MKKILLLLCSFLFLGGSNSWADPTTLYEKGTTGHAWASADLEDWTFVGSDGQEINASGYLRFYKSTIARTEYTSTHSLTTTDGYVVTMNLLWNVENANGSATAGCYVKFGDVTLFWCGQNRDLKITIGSTETTLISGGNTNLRGTDFNVEISINKTTNGVKYSISNSLYNSGTPITGSGTSATGDVSNVIFGWWRGGQQNASSQIVKSIVVTEEEYSAPTANYTVHFVDNNSVTVKADDVRNGEVGAAVGASADDKASFIADGNKYVYSTDGGGTTITNDGSAEFTVTYTKYVNTSYTVKAQVSGSDLTTLASGTAYLDGSTTAYWNKYINVDDQWYVADETTYGLAITTATNNVAFTAVDDIDYFFEAENMTYSKTFNTYNGTAASNGTANTLYADANAQTTSTVSRGKYNISISGIKWADNSDTYQIAYSTDRANWIALGTVTYATGTEGVRTLENVIIPAESYIRIWATMGSQTPRRYLDYIILDRTQEYTDVEIAIIDCKQYETSDAFAEAVEAESFSTAEEVYAFHTAWQIAKAKASGSTDITKVIRNAAIADVTDWTNARIWSGEKYTGAPDEFYLDQYQATLDAYQTVYGLPAGSYKVKAATRGSAGASGNIYVYAAEQVDKNAAINLDGNTGGTLGQGWSWTEVEFTLTATSDVKIGFWCNASASEQWAGCDDFHLYAEGVSVTLPSSGYGSLALSYGLDFSCVEGLTAFVVSEITKTAVRLTSVDELPANSGVILKGTPGATYSIPVKADASYDGTNKLYAAVTAYNCAANEVYILQSGQFHLVTAASTVPAGKAYLKAEDVPTEARTLIFCDEEDPTAINAVNATEAEAQKDGKYLENGKIVIVKNGIKYSANGQILK